MHIFNAEKQEIEKVKQRVQAERALLATQVSEILPQASRAAAVGSAVYALRRYAPLLRPLAIGVAQRCLTSRVVGKLLKIVALGAAGYGAWQLLGSGDKDSEA